MSYVGKIYPSVLQFYDVKTKSQRNKSRPVLIIAEPIGKDTEYTVLPVSTLLNRRFYDPRYDVQIKVENFDKLRLTKECFIRSHKQTTVYKANIDFNKLIGDLKNDYPDCFYDILDKLEKFNGEIQACAKR